MKQEPAPKSHRIAALFAAAAFLPTPALAQVAPAQEVPPVLADPTPPVTTTPPVSTTTPPVQTEAPPVATTPPATQTPRQPLLTDPLPAEEPVATSANRRSPRANRAAPTAARPAPAATRAAPVRAAPAEAVAPAAAAPAPAAPEAAAPEAIPPADAPPAAAPAAADPAAAPPAAENAGGANWLWLVAGAALLLGALAFLMRRRRHGHDDVEQQAYEPPAYRHEPAVAADVEPHQAAPVPVVATAAAVDAPAAEQGRPWLELLMRPVRAGVQGEDAIVEFELSVDNQGSAVARDVRISTWMFPAGAAQESEMERMLIDRAPAAALPKVTIDAGDARRIATAVALPTAGLPMDAVLPVVVADARYVLPDGSEGHTWASFAVGVPDGEELAHFAIDNPSGLHEGVEARPLGEPERN